ncbi:MAG: homoserine O-acetyltransferase [Sandaracinaceae bacterium]|nr:homoserine O-acetyltransferase [Sandaracinaceae bacterium]
MTDGFESTDSNRSGAVLEALRVVRLAEGLTTASGETLRDVQVAYETYGELNAARDNAVLLCHAMSGDSHVARHHPEDSPGWWERLVGPGRAIDTDHFFVICSNVLGGCRGTTGPASTDPATQRPYGSSFPTITVEDMVDVQQRLLTQLGITHLRAVVGGSLGGHQALCWATRYPSWVTTAVVIAASARLSSQALAFDVVGRNAILSDPHFAGGQYYGAEAQPDTGLAIARMVAHITYLSSASMDEKFELDRHRPRELATAFEKRFSVGSYLAYQGERFVERFDANSYVTISLALDQFDLGATEAERRAALSRATCDWLVISFSSDWLFPPAQSRQLVESMTALGQPVTYCEVPTDGGHDGFLLPDEIDHYAPLVAAKLGRRSAHAPAIKPEHHRIVELIAEGASVLDLGCGDGALLAHLRERGHSDLCGVDVDSAKLTAAAQYGVEVLDYDLNLGLPQFGDQRFDYVVIASTLQAVPDVQKMLLDALRVGRFAILSMGNFAYRPLREMFYREGRVPKSPDGVFPYEWYDTPNRRFPSIRDVLDLCEQLDIAVVDARYYALAEEGRSVSAEEDANLAADTAVLLLQRRGHADAPPS